MAAKSWKGIRKGTWEVCGVPALNVNVEPHSRFPRAFLNSLSYKECEEKSIAVLSLRVDYLRSSPRRNDL